MDEERTVADGLFAIAAALQRLGNADAATPMGGLEALGQAMIDSAQKIADAMEDAAQKIADALEQQAGGRISRVPAPPGKYDGVGQKIGSAPNVK